MFSALALVFLAALATCGQAVFSLSTVQTSLSRRLRAGVLPNPELTREDAASLVGDWKVKGKDVHFFSPDLARAALIEQVASGRISNLQQAFNAGAAPGDSEDLAGSHLVIGHLDPASGYFYGMASAIVGGEMLGAHQAVGRVTKAPEGLTFTGNVLAHDGNPLTPITGYLSRDGTLHLHWSSLYSGPVDPSTGTAPPSVNADSTYQASAVMVKSGRSVAELFSEAIKLDLL